MIVSDSRWDEVVAGRVYPRDQRVTTRVNIKEILRDLKKRANLIARAVRFLIG